MTWAPNFCQARCHVCLWGVGVAGQSSERDPVQRSFLLASPVYIFSSPFCIQTLLGGQGIFSNLEMMLGFKKNSHRAMQVLILPAGLSLLPGCYH